MPLTEVKIEGFIGTICLDHFERRNAFSAALADEITKALESFVEAACTRRHPEGEARREDLVGLPRHR